MCDGEINEFVTQQQQHQLCQTSTNSNSPTLPPTPITPQQQQQRLDETKAVKITRSGKAPAAAQEALDVQKLPHWKLEDVLSWANNREHFSRSLLECLRLESIDGEVLLALTEADVRDMRYKLGYKLTFGELKKFWLAVLKLQLQIKDADFSFSRPVMLGITGPLAQAAAYTTNNGLMPLPPLQVSPAACPCPTQECPSYVSDCDAYRRKICVAPEYFKTSISLGYSFLVTWITSFVMVIVHERVPDMKRYPPLPDIFLDNVPHIPWAFNMCEITGSLLFTVWLIVLTFHKYRMVLLRRFFALAGTVFLLRCVTMLITSLSVPGTHLQCSQKDFAIEDPNVDMVGALWIRMTRAYKIWSGLGMSIQGVRTCGDYMFSGHTVALTLLNFFITEYTPRNLYFLHTLTWLLNMFGIFFILAAHEHYSIDVFVAFYITSRLFLYYHTLANNRALMQIDSKRTRIWFPMFSYFENAVDGIIPNEFDTPGTLLDKLLYQIINIKDLVWMLVTRLWMKPSDEESSSKSFASESDLNVRANAAPSFYFSPNQSLTSGMHANINAHTNPNNTVPTHSLNPQTNRTNTPQLQRKVYQEANANATGSSKEKSKCYATPTTPLADKKLL